MNLLSSPKRKLLVAGAMLCVLPVLAALQGASAATAARVLLGLGAAAGLAFWLWRGRRAGARFELPPRLSVVQKVGLSQRTGLALVEVDGEAYLVVHGDGFARIRKSRRAAPAARRLVTDEVPAAQRAARRVSRRNAHGGVS